MSTGNWIEVTGEPDTMKMVRPVLRGADGKGPKETVPRRQPTLQSRAHLRPSYYLM